MYGNTNNQITEVIKYSELYINNYVISCIMVFVNDVKINPNRTTFIIRLSKITTWMY